MADFARARALLQQFKKGTYLHGLGVMPRVGAAVAKHGKRALLLRPKFEASEAFVKQIRDSMDAAGVTRIGEIPGARPNAPYEDVARITAELKKLNPDVIVSFGGGSTIDAVKAAEVMRTLGGAYENYYGMGLVGKALAQAGRTLTPHVAIQTAASSAAHLTKYSNITDMATGQKKLIIDESIVPIQPVFDYNVTFGAPAELTADGALDGCSHCLEVLYGAVGKPHYGLVEEIAREAIQAVVKFLPQAMAAPRDAEAREALGLATDLGGYAIMVGGTNGGHLTSFSLVDVVAHGRACAILNPYYTVFFAPAIQAPLRVVGGIYEAAGYAPHGIANLSGRELGVAVARAMIAFQQKIGFPTRLGDVPAFTPAHITRALTAAKNPQLKSKLENMPVALTADLVDEYMGLVLEAAKTGDLGLIRNLA
ncbi:MAG: hypothetical protein A3K19_12675 [Lentisphaerae bacterium RIFOXYB12_FULL_65_16]|nr:MAG: hypothetical protein A3K18_24375 [Lentisphaerae bacterium RIFOXYA12_64_32]OGV88078.1 MAG: hypothetical protein A3K19_12675 [Lentisphaerae bacterium RIFOXYB12_FULL_65_16]